MQPEVQILSGLERRVDLNVSLADVERAVQSQLRRIARTAKVQGFRPGKAPMAIIERSHGPNVRYDVINEEVGKALDTVLKSSELRVAGTPSLQPHPDEAPEGVLAFQATFEVFPEVALPALSTLTIKRVQAEVGDAEIDQTFDILRRQRAVFEAREGREAADGDQVTVDFVGTIDDVPFDGGTAEGFPFVLGQGRMLAEFEEGVRGKKAGDVVTFPLAFPADYGGKEVAGKTASFTVTVREVAEAVLPELNEEFARSLGQAEGDVEKLRAEVRQNIEREVRQRTLARTKENVMNALTESVSFDVPKALVEEDIESRIASAREELKQRGVPNADSVPIPADTFREAAERRVRLGLVVGELIREAGLKARPEQVRARIEEFAQSYEQPAQVVAYYLSDRQRRAEIEAVVLEDNVVEHVLSQAKTEDEQVPFQTLMGTN